MLRVGVLASGSGSNFEALATSLAQPGSPATVAALVCNVPGAPAFARAERLGVRSYSLDHRGFAERASFETSVVAALREAQCELVCLAGFMRLAGPTLLGAFPGRILNLHPALLPAFPGLHAIRQALDYGAKVTGCTVHFVDAGLDTGPVIAQTAVPILSDDTEASLAERIHAEEHRLYPQVVRWIAEGKTRFDGRRVLVAP